MELKEGKMYSGFKLKTQKSVEEIHSRMHLFEHAKSGAKLVFFENEDDNKVFSISFRTPPADSTGVAHILEHSVLCGSRKFPLKEPFVELVKGSLNTFLNAMTFPDKTMYPVASRNDADFHNLMDVYLDAVFFPMLYKTPEILMQEGWHYDIEDPKADLTYNGVVYNEMKGVFSSPEALLDRKIQESLFPNSPYGVESGGDPEFIPDLTQVEFEEFHSRYYHPANSYIFLYGNPDIEQTLAFIDQEYLSKFDKAKVDSRIKRQRAFTKPHIQTVEYPVSAQSATQDRAFLSMNFVVGDSTDPELCLAFSILKHMLLDTPAAPLKQALIDAALGKDVVGSFDDNIMQPVFSVVVRNSNTDAADRFHAVVLDTLRGLVKHGIDKKLIESSINSKEFQLREANFANRPKGLIYNIKCMNSWLYDADPSSHLAYEDSLARIKTALTRPYFENLVDKYLLKNTHRSTVILAPKPGLQEQKTTEVREKLAAYKASLSENEIADLIVKTKALRKRQATPDPDSAMRTIPLLSLKDIEPKSEQLPLTEREEQDVKVLWHNLFTNHITYVNFYFDARKIPTDLAPYAYLLAGILGKVDTEAYSYSELSNELNIHTGGITYQPQAFSLHKSPDRFRPKFVIKTKALTEKLPRMFLLLAEIIGHSQLGQEKRLEELIREMRSQWESAIIEMGQMITAGRVLSYFSAAGKFKEMGLLSFYRFVAGLERDLASRREDIVDGLVKTAKLLFNRQGLLVSITTDKEGYERFQRDFGLLLDKLQNLETSLADFSFRPAANNEGLMTSGKIQFVAKGGNFRQLGYEYSGSMKVLETILRYDYLWNTVRVKGGAYGGYANFARCGDIVFGSYRDPNLMETLQVFDETPEYLSRFAVDDREMTKYIIGTMSQLDTPLTAPMKGERATKYYIEQISYEDVQQERNEILGTRQKDIQRLASVVTDVMKQNYLCVLGNEDKIKRHQDVFHQLEDVYES